MDHLRWVWIIFVLALGTAPTVWANQDKSVSLVMTPYTFVTQDGRRVEAELARLKVPENRRSQQRRSIELAVVPFESTATHPGPPIFIYLEVQGRPQ